VDLDASRRQWERDSAGPDSQLERAATSRHIREEIDRPVDQRGIEDTVVRLVIRSRNGLAEVSIRVVAHRLNLAESTDDSRRIKQSCGLNDGDAARTPAARRTAARLLRRRDRRDRRADGHLASRLAADRLLDPLLAAAGQRKIRLASYARPSYGGSTAMPGRDVASAAADAGHVADALGIRRFAVMGASGGGPPALACAALMSDRESAVVALASPAPYTEEFDWFAGMAAPGSLHAAFAGREARTHYAETEEFDANQFTAADWATLEGPWASLGRDAGAAQEAGPDGLIEDDLTIVKPWGFDLDTVRAPVLLIQGGEDRVIPASHADALLRAIPTAELWLRPRDGHVSVLTACGVAMDWLLAMSRSG
jgi:pimeloyl-ACP methyl ester carboxylesterase